MKGNTVVTIEQDSFEDLMAGRTGNPMADEDIPKMLRLAIKAGRLVLLTDSNHQAIHILQLDTKERFKYVLVT